MLSELHQLKWKAYHFSFNILDCMPVMMPAMISGFSKQCEATITELGELVKNCNNNNKK